MSAAQKVLGVARGLAMSVAMLALALIGTLIVVFIIGANSYTDAIFRCEGTLGEQAEGHSTTLFMTLREYRWFMLWDNSDGTVVIEAPKEGLPMELYLGVNSVGAYRHIYEDSEQPMTLRGSFHKVSGYLMLDTSHGHFEGECVPKKD